MKATISITCYAAFVKGWTGLKWRKTKEIPALYKLVGQLESLFGQKRDIKAQSLRFIHKVILWRAVCTINAEKIAGNQLLEQEIGRGGISRFIVVADARTSESSSKALPKLRR